MRSCLVMGVVKKKNPDQTLPDLSNCSSPSTDIFISAHEKAVAKLVVIGLTLSLCIKLFGNQKFSGSKNK